MSVAEIRNIPFSSRAISITLMMRQRQGGFTLLEVLIAVAISAALATALYASFFSVFKSRVSIEAEAGRLTEAGRFLDGLSREVQSAYYNDSNKKTAFVGEKREIKGGSASGIKFTAFINPTQTDLGAGGELHAIRYAIEEDKAGSLVLYKEVWDPYVAGEGDGNGVVKVPVIEGIARFDLMYLTGPNWVPVWDSSKEKKTPLAVKATISFSSDPKTEFTIMARTMIK
jgi:type II secretion system protein J